jgi:hypothetical protein
MWVEQLTPVFRQSITCEYASLTGKGQPITYPCTPYIGDHTLDVTTGLAYPAKAERARRNPKVALLYSNSIGSGLDNPPTALVYGYAAVRDKDLQANTDRYVRDSLCRFPEVYKGVPPFMLKQMVWYFARIRIEVTPIRILWWNDPDQPAQEWRASSAAQIPASDPAPQGTPQPAWLDAPKDWQANAAYAARTLGAPVLTVVDQDGFPVPFRVKRAAAATDGFRLAFYDGAPVVPQGRACLTFHTHPEVFTGQENLVFVGDVSPDGAFRVQRQLADWSLKGKPLQRTMSFMLNGLKLAPRLRAEASRRGQRVPKVKLPF